MLSPDEVLKLATAYAGHTGKRLSTVGRDACNNDKIFVRIARGGSAMARSILEATDWFEENWPADLRWPKGVPGGPRIAPSLVAHSEPAPAHPSKSKSRRMAAA